MVGTQLISVISNANVDEIKVYTELLSRYQYIADGKVTGIATQNHKKISITAKPGKQSHIFH